MAKKSFRGGLGSLLEDTIKKAEKERQENKDVEKNESTETLKAEISLLKQELALWRNGQLNVALFQESLQEKGLHYDAARNSISKKA